MTLRGKGAEFPFRYAVPRERRRLQRKRLSGPAFFARNIAGWDRTLFSAKDRFTGPPVQDEQQTHLCGFGEGRNSLAVPYHSHQSGWGSDVVVEEIVVNQLVEPT